MADVTLVSYDLKGVKESFANWISNISPTDTPFVSMTGKEAIQNKYFQWQTDKLAAAGDNAVAEGSPADAGTLAPTEIQKNVTQILRKVVRVSDTADALSSYGRGSELAYQMEKAGAEIKRDLEHGFLNNGDVVDGVMPGTPSTGSGATLNVRKTAGFTSLVNKTTGSPEDTTRKVTLTAGVVADFAPQGLVAADLSSVQGTFNENELFALTENLYIAGANPNIIMFHPKHAKFFSGLMEANGGTRQRMFDGETDTKVNTYVATLVDPLGQEFKLIPNRFMDPKAVFVFNPSDWTQMVLRAPQRIKLAKDGSYEKWMIEMEVGLRHRNPFASGVLNVKA